MANHEQHDSIVKSRVEQLDALELDNEVLHVLKNQLMKVMKNLPPSLQNNLEAEADTILQLTVFHLSLKAVGATFGQQLLNIKFLKSQRRTAFLVVIIPILLKYVHSRAGDLASKIGKRKIKILTEQSTHWGEVLISAGSLINLLLFLHSGYYPNLLYRIFGVEMAYTSPSGRQRQVGYTHMTRELIWHSFIELLVFVLPLINYHFIKRQVLKVLMLGTQVSKSRQNEKTKISMTVNTHCVVCSQRPILPHHMGCGHIFCFYCLQANILADPHFACPYCGHRAAGLTSATRVVTTAM